LYPSPKHELKKAIIIFKDIASALLPSFMGTETSTHYKKPEMEHIHIES